MFNLHALRGKRLYVVGAIVVIAVVLAGGGFWLLNRTTTSSQQILKHPLKIGSYRYVNACQALPFTAYKQAYGYPISTNSLLEQTYADGFTKPVGNDGVFSSCTGEIDMGSGHTQFTENFLSEYPTVDRAKSNYDALSKDNDPVPGLSNVTYDPDQSAVYALIRNVVLTMTISSSSDVSDDTPLNADTLVAIAQQAVPFITTNITSNTLPQTPYDIAKGQPKIGASTYFNPCEYITDSTFQHIFNTPSDRSNIDVTSFYNAPQHTARIKDIFEGLADVGCDRSDQLLQSKPSDEDLISGKLSQDQYDKQEAAYDKGSDHHLYVDVKFFKDSAQAQQQAKVLADTNTDALSVKTVASPKIGDYSVIETGDLQHNDAKTEMIVAKNSYVIQIDLTYDKNDNSGHFDKYPTIAQYETAAKLLIKTLPLN